MRRRIRRAGTYLRQMVLREKVGHVAGGIALEALFEWSSEELRECRVDEAVGASDKETAQDALRVVSRKLDKAVSKGVLHKNNAANKKSGLAKLVAKI